MPPAHARSRQPGTFLEIEKLPKINRYEAARQGSAARIPSDGEWSFRRKPAKAGMQAVDAELR